MGRYDRLIKLAFDRISNRTVDADELFDTKKNAFEIRKQFHRDEFDFYCKECEQPLGISTSKYDRLHFKHEKGADYCILKDEDLSPEERENFTLNLKFKESDRHKHLKNRIADLLRMNTGIDPSAISVDDKFIIRGSEKRRPDVYCVFEDKQIVFEIQLSNLSLRYILSRYDFYKRHGIYLIWILDDFDVHGQGQMERDIKYLNQYQNFFKLDESQSSFKLLCDYKYALLNQDNIVLTPWAKKSIALTELKFDKVSYQTYYYDFDKNKSAREQERSERIAILREEERKRLEEKILLKAKDKSREIIEQIRMLHNRKSQTYAGPIELIADLQDSEVSVFNNELKLSETVPGKAPALHKWLEAYSTEEFSFLHFVLTTERIWLNVNDANPSGDSTLMKIYNHPKVPKSILSKLIFRRGYVFTKGDEDFLRNIGDPDLEGQMIIYRMCSDLSNKKLVDRVFDFQKEILIVESAKQNRLVGYNFKGNGAWIAFANNAIEYHSEYWEYFELAFKYYGLWEQLIKNDKKGSFQKKLANFYQNIPPQKFDFDRIFRTVFTEFESAPLAFV
ncbi:MAG TPA: DUF6035 family protein [Chryseosolibacter sp.]